MGAWGDKDSWVDDVTNESRVLYGTIAADLTPDTTATFSINHRARDITPFNGLPTDAAGNLLDLDRDTFTGADWNGFENEVTDYIAEVEHRFADGGHIKASALYSDVDADYFYGFAGSAATNGSVSRLSYLRRDFEQQALSLDLHVSRPFTWFGRENNLIVGVDHRRDDNGYREARGAIPDSGFDLNMGSQGITRPDAPFTARQQNDVRQTGLYAQWRIKPADTWTVIAGGRLSWYDGEVRDTVLATGAVTASKVDEDAEFTPYFGAIKDISDTTSVYGSYTETFQPQVNTTVSGEVIKPRTGRQYEIGVKSELMPGLNTSVALFDIKDENRAVGDVLNPGSSIAQGTARVRGLEAEASGAIAPNWEITAGYTYTETDFENTAGADGAEFYSPRHMLQLWAKYRFQKPGWDKLAIGGGIRAYSGFSNITRRGGGVLSDIKAPGYAVADLMASYDVTDQVQASLSVNNLFDKSYYERVGGVSVFNFYGEPRSVNFKLSAKF